MHFLNLRFSLWDVSSKYWNSCWIFDWIIPCTFVWCCLIRVSFLKEVHSYNYLKISTHIIVFKKNKISSNVKYYNDPTHGMNISFDDFNIDLSGIDSISVWSFSLVGPPTLSRLTHFTLLIRSVLFRKLHEQSIVWFWTFSKVNTHD